MGWFCRYKNFADGISINRGETQEREGQQVQIRRLAGLRAALTCLIAELRILDIWAQPQNDFYQSLVLFTGCY